jgi:hypothetical protein
MNAVVLQKPRSRPEQSPRRVRLNCDDHGGWVVSAPGDRPRRFSDVDAALDALREAPETQRTTIEFWQDGEYICCLVPEDRPGLGAGDPFGRVTPHPRRLTPAERHANRAAEAVAKIAGPFFWLALLALLLAASLGGRLAPH